ncbi:hypothetical protein HDK90DRAFT_422981 [Phyllosticta capitalensis]|uniref:Zinc-binding loop region of homing endonuclease domain-containing protein n=1 Tax=Phyllosticta capitalensis TaxID=121624 RepID=A0ABR1Y9U3_9PEZI
MSLRGYDAKQPYAHQVAAATTKYGKIPPLTTTGQKPDQYKFSQLYYNPCCLNPQHVVIELDRDNKARNACQGSHILVFNEGKATYNPYPHD